MAGEKINSFGSLPCCVSFNLSGVLRLSVCTTGYFDLLTTVPDAFPLGAPETSRFKPPR